MEDHNAEEKGVTKERLLPIAWVTTHTDRHVSPFRGEGDDPIFKLQFRDRQEKLEGAQGERGRDGTTPTHVVGLEPGRAAGLGPKSRRYCCRCRLMCKERRAAEQ